MLASSTANPVDADARSQRTILGAVLVGGKNRRMGSPKHEIVLVDGRSMLAHVCSAVRECVSLILVVGITDSPNPPGDEGLVYLPDANPGLGPLAGIEAALQSGLAEGYIFAACDQPLLTSRLLRRLLTRADANGVFFSRLSRIDDPLPCYIPVEWLPAVRQALKSEQLSLRRLAASLNPVLLELEPGDPRSLSNINTPAELSALGTHVIEEHAND